MYRVIFLVALAGVSGAAAQAPATSGKMSGAGQSARADQQYAIQVPDRPDHTFSIRQNKFTWTTAWEILGVRAVGGVDTSSTETSGTTAHFRGLYVETMENGDKAFYQYQGTTLVGPDAPRTFEANWALIGGTGKLEKVRGKGTCKIQPQGDGTSYYECEGEYQLAK